MLGFKTRKQAVAIGSWNGFQPSKLRRYSFWVRIRLSVLVLVGYSKIEDLHIEEPGNVQETMEWVEECRKIPGFPEAVEKGAKIRFSEDFENKG